MITVNEAYDIAKQKYDFARLMCSLEFDSFYLFSFAPLFMDTTTGYYTGTEFDAVDKKDGRTFLYDITSDPDAFEKAKPIQIKTFLDERI